ncbi:MAG: PaaI family thioesterase [Candidatus Eisenbacteria bacterium]|nr:PaaI family thioesterase [Candidatus Eisenbacteria bacterium]
MADDRMCFACGPDNPHGLHLSFDYGDGEVTTRHTFDGRYQGYSGVVHGGLVSTVLDETMVTLLNRMGLLAMTAELTVRYSSPVPVGEEVTVTARLVRSRRRVHEVEAEATLPDGEVAATARGRFMSLGPLHDEAPSTG